MPLKIIRQDITKIKCDAIVNPSNERLLPGGGTDAAIHKAAGEKLLEACKKLGGINIGEAKLTSAYKLPCKYVIHTAGPIWQGGSYNERSLLEACYKNALTLAKEKKCKSVAFPLISSGVYGYPKEQVMKIAMGVIGDFLFENEMLVYLVVFDKTSYAISEKLFADVTSFIGDTYFENDFGALLFNSLGPDDLAFGCGRAPENIEKDRRKDFAEPIDAEARVPLASPAPAAYSASAPKKSANLEEMLRKMDKGFAETLFDYIDAKGFTDVECYKRANVDKKTFSKIKCNKNYKPSKVTAVSFAIALHLNLAETNHLLNTVGMSLSHSNKFDVIIEYFIVSGNYETIFDVNETLYQFDQVTLGV
ncbi:MAG: macro domain-containing protein [Clostridia bacterium]|nr:macro domain-containing protein [Clostridia bacterium]